MTSTVDNPKIIPDKNIEILIVEDSITQVAQLKYILQKKGYHVSAAR